MLASKGPGTASRRQAVVTTAEILADDILRVGLDGQDDHLIEHAATRFLHGPECRIDRLGVLHYDDVHLLRELLLERDPNSPYSVIVRGARGHVPANMQLLPSR